MKGFEAEAKSFLEDMRAKGVTVAEAKDVKDILKTGSKVVAPRV